MAQVAVAEAAIMQVVATTRPLAEAAVEVLCLGGFILLTHCQRL
tara:strand:- start:661 stop:792 length:132 start_codon:yes stop_codon:yes gene_type:complete